MYRLCSSQLFSLALFLLAINNPKQVQAFIDQDSGKTQSGIINVDSTALTWQQGVTAGASGLLVGIDILPQRGTFNPPTESMRFFVNTGPAWQTDQHEFDTIVSFDAQDTSQPWFYIDVTNAGIWLKPGDQFVWGVQEIGDGAAIFFFQLGYPGGRLWLNGTPLGQDRDASFRTHMVVPEPTTSLLTALAFSGLLLQRRSRFSD